MIAFRVRFSPQKPALFVRRCLCAHNAIFAYAKRRTLRHLSLGLKGDTLNNRR
jgi:hypothetical protein